MRCFDRLNPIVAFMYFVLTLVISMISLNPIIIGISYIFSLLLYGLLKGFRNLFKSLIYSLVILLLIALTNPLFVHKGETILFFLNENPVTKESILYGFTTATMLLTVYYWCSCYSEIMSSDKFIYLFGKITPKLSLLLSMALGFIPKLKRKYNEINEAQKGLGIYSSKSYVDKIKSKFRVLSILLTNSLENSIDTADSMRARGYGLKGRTSYEIYKFTLSDLLYLIFILCVSIICIVLIILGYSDFSFYPIISYKEVTILSIMLYVSLLLLVGSSIFMEVKENILWHYLKSKI